MLAWAPTEAEDRAWKQAGALAWAENQAWKWVPAAAEA